MALDVIISTIGSGVSADFVDLPSWWNVVKDINLEASGQTHVAELLPGHHVYEAGNGRFVFEGSVSGGTEQNRYVVRARNDARFNGTFYEPHINGEAAVVKYRLWSETPYLDFEGFVIGDIQESYHLGHAVSFGNFGDPQHAALVLRDGASHIRRMGIWNISAEVDEPADNTGPLSIPPNGCSNNAAGILVLTDDVVIENTVINGVRVVGSGGSHPIGQNESTMRAAGIHVNGSYNTKIINCTFADITAYLSTNVVVDSGGWVGAFGVVWIGGGNLNDAGIVRNNLIGVCQGGRVQFPPSEPISQSSTEAQGSFCCPNLEPGFLIDDAVVFEYNHGFDHSSPDGNLYTCEDFDWHYNSYAAPFPVKQTSTNGIFGYSGDIWTISPTTHLGGVLDDSTTYGADFHTASDSRFIGSGWYGESQLGGHSLGSDFVNTHTPFIDIDGVFRELGGGQYCDPGIDELGSGTLNICTLYIESENLRENLIPLFIDTWDDYDNHVLGDNFEGEKGLWTGQWTQNNDIPGQGFLLASNNAGDQTLHNTVLDYYTHGLDKEPYNYDVRFEAEASGGMGSTWEGKYGIYLRYLDGLNNILVWFDVDNDTVFIDTTVGGVGYSSSPTFLTMSETLFPDGETKELYLNVKDDKINISYDGNPQGEFTLPSQATELYDTNKIGFSTVDNPTDANGYFRVHTLTVGNPQLPLYLHAPQRLINAACPLFIYKEAPASGLPPLWLFGASGEHLTIPLHMGDAIGEFTDDIPLMTQGPFIPQSGVDMFVHGHDLFNSKYDHAGDWYCDDFDTDNISSDYNLSSSGTWFIDVSGERLQLDSDGATFEADVGKRLIVNTGIDRILHGAKTHVTSEPDVNDFKAAGLYINYSDDTHFYFAQVTEIIGIVNYLEAGEVNIFVPDSGDPVGTVNNLLFKSLPRSTYGDLWKNGFDFKFQRPHPDTLQIYIDDNLTEVTIDPNVLPSGDRAGIGIGLEHGSGSGVFWDDFCHYNLQPHLYVYGHETLPGSMTLYTTGPAIPSGYLDLYTGSKAIKSQFVYLHIGTEDLHPHSGSMSLHTWASSNSGVFNSMPMYVEAFAFVDDIYLYIEAADVGNVPGSIFLAIPAPENPFIDNTIDLFIANSGTFGSLDLYTSGLSLSGDVDSAGVPLTGTTYLFINRPDYPEVRSLFIEGRESGPTTLSTELYVGGATGLPSGEMNMFTKAAVMPNQNVILYTHGF